MISGSISVDVPGLTKVKRPLKFRFESENPILLQILSTEDNTMWAEYVISID